MSELGLKKIFKTVKHSYVPAVIFGAAVFLYCCMPQWAPDELSLLNGGFFVLCTANIIFLIMANRTKPLFVLLWTMGVYIGVNHLKAGYGEDFTITASYILILGLLPLNWLFFTLLPQRTLNHSRNFYYLCVVLLQGMCIENMGLLPQRLLIADGIYCISGFWLIILTVLLIISSRRPGITETGMFFALLSLMLGLANAASAVSLAVYFTTAALILFIVSIHEYVYTYFRDALTGVYSRNSYYMHAQKSFPLKYTLGVICIDDYGKLLKVFGEKRLNLLTKMAIDKIQSAGTGADIYRYEDDEFILIFKNLDLKQSYEYLENIRRSIAGSEFVLSAKKMVKITISAGVSEKKRSDADVDAVLARTREVLQKAYKFTQNMTSKA